MKLKTSLSFQGDHCAFFSDLDTIKISGTASNNGVFTVSSIVLNATGGSDDDVYYVLKVFQNLLA